ncbi:MAG: hypothetical protein KAU31_03395, partial [Spirochaetaceae bacterium]|nr:hypothetical protein [Spirochaetaceae bacterium]
YKVGAAGSAFLLDRLPVDQPVPAMVQTVECGIADNPPTCSRLWCEKGGEAVGVSRFAAG